MRLQKLYMPTVGMRWLARSLCLFLLLGPLAVSAQMSFDPTQRRSLRSRSDDGDTERESRSSRSSRSSRTERSRDEGGEQRNEQTIDAPTAGGVQRARGGQERTAVSSSRAGGGGGSRTRGGGQSAPLPEIKVFEGVERNALYLTPASQQVQLNERFKTQLEFYNPRGATVDRFDVWIQYDPELLELRWIDPEPLAGRLASPLQPKGWPSVGLVHLQGELTRPLEQKIVPMVELHWTALAPSPQARIELNAPPQQQVALYDGQSNVIDVSGTGNRARVSASISIIDPEARSALRMAENVLGALTRVPMDPEQRVRLAITTPEGSVSPGETGIADVVLINPAQEPLERVSFRIRYDPLAMTVLDADADNYVTRGINIFDGDFHNRFPFTYHGVNNVDPRRGIIQYEAGSTNGPTVFESGTIARIVYRVAPDAVSPGFWFERTDGFGLKATDVSVNSQSLLGPNDETAREALHGAMIGLAEPTGTAATDALAALPASSR